MSAERLVLYHYYRSSSSWRVRWALRWKGLPYEAVPVNLLAGEQAAPAHRARNPLCMVPVLQVGERWLGESVAILEYLEERWPRPPLLPEGDALLRARVRQLVQVINADTQPLQNLSVLRHLSTEPEARERWAQHFISRGLDSYEALLAEDGRAPAQARFSVGDSLTMADLFLIPQCYNARRQKLSLERWPRVMAVEAWCGQLPEARASAPEAFAGG